MVIREHIPLAPLTTLGVGGPARFFVEVASADEACEAVEWARARQQPIFVLGGGSNLVVADTGFPGLVLKIGIRGIAVRDEVAEGLFAVGAGEDWDSFVACAVSRNCAGIECLSGIPGTVGATPVQNVGAYGQEVSNTLHSVEVLEIVTGARTHFDAAQCGFGYRTSIFNTTERGRYIVLQVIFALRPGGTAPIEYADLKQHFGRRIPGLAEVREAVRQIRRHKGMLLVEGEEDCRSAGSFFKNPILTAEQHAALCRRAESYGLSIPAYPAASARHKVPAAWLIENAGFHRGYAHGRAGLSQRHALAFVNRGGANATDVMALKAEIQSRVRERFGLDLEPEPIFVGFQGTHG
jgi:UDP-N-acetylmuramate dehydrogenase